MPSTLARTLGPKWGGGAGHNCFPEEPLSVDSKEMKPVEIKMKNLLEPHLWVVPFLWFPIKGPFEKLCLTKLSKNLFPQY